MYGSIASYRTPGLVQKISSKANTRVILQLIANWYVLGKGRRRCCQRGSMAGSKGPPCSRDPHTIQTRLSSAALEEWGKSSVCFIPGCGVSACSKLPSCFIRTTEQPHVSSTDTGSVPTPEKMLHIRDNGSKEEWISKWPGK